MSDLLGSILMMALGGLAYFFIGRYMGLKRNYDKYYFCVLGVMGLMTPFLVDSDSGYFLFVEVVLLGFCFLLNRK